MSALALSEISAQESTSILTTPPHDWLRRFLCPTYLGVTGPPPRLVLKVYVLEARPGSLSAREQFAANWSQT